jgi:hypothetical protein
MGKIEITPQINGNQIVYKYGVRISPDSVPDIDGQIRVARAMLTVRGIVDIILLYMRC